MKPTSPDDWKLHPGHSSGIYIGGTGHDRQIIEASSPEQAHMIYTSHLAQIEENRLQENRAAVRRIKKHPELEIVRQPVKRRISQPRFWMGYDTLQDAQRRLLQSLVYIGAYPYWITDLAELAPEKYIAAVQDEREQMFHVDLSDPDVDLRSFEPQYVTAQNGCLWLFRYPSRHQKQGPDTQNMGCQFVGSGSPSRLNVPVSEIIFNLKNQEPIVWSGAHQKLLATRAVRQLRLSPQVAVLSAPGGIGLEYRTRLVGEVKDDIVVMDDKDKRPWIAETLKEVGLNVAS
jgi:hypothetical protein